LVILPQVKAYAHLQMLRRYVSRYLLIFELSIDYKTLKRGGREKNIPQVVKCSANIIKARLFIYRLTTAKVSV